MNQPTNPNDVSKKQFFGTDGIRGTVGTSPITPDFVLKLGWAVGKVFANQERSKVVIGKDTRISGYMLESALEAGLSAAGCDILLLGPMPTPAIAYLTKALKAQAGIVISASHNPYYDNGIKFFCRHGNKLPDTKELEIEEQLHLPLECVSSEKLGKASRVDDAARRYLEFCKYTLRDHVVFNKIKIVIDCAHGATYNIAPRLFSELGAHIIPIAISPDGFNINKNCGSTHADILKQRVLEEKANLGVSLDGDGDRVIMVDHEGTILDGDILVYILACYLQSTQLLHGGVVGTVMSNLGLEQALCRLNIEFLRTNVGDRYVMEALTQKDWRLGGESSGHIINLNATTTGDGLITALHILAIMETTGKNLKELREGIHLLPQALVNVRLTSKINSDKQSKLQSVVQKAEKMLADKGRILLRPSGTEPVIRVMVEGEDEVKIKQLANELAKQVEMVCQ